MLVMMDSIIFNYLIALRIAELRDNPSNKSQGLKKVNDGGSCGNIGVLFIYKYLMYTAIQRCRRIRRTWKNRREINKKMLLGKYFSTSC